MARITVVTPAKTRPVAPPGGFAGLGGAQAWFDDDRFPLQLIGHRVAPGETMTIGPMSVTCVAYIWHGAVEAEGHRLAAGSSLVVEHGASLELVGTNVLATVLTFRASAAQPGSRRGGHVHLLPTERVARMALQGEEPSGVEGGMHADGSCPTCEVWLHENRFPPAEAPTTSEAIRHGVHAHSKAEIIFVTAGAMRLGHRLVGPGTAVGVGADVMYAFTAGPEGLAFINFRAGTPGDIHFANGTSMSETGYWRETGLVPRWLEPVAG
jgi:hypothetical protein